MNAEPLRAEETHPSGVRFYTVVCALALLTSALALLMRGMELWSLFPAAVGGLALAVRWRTGPALFVGSLVWLVLSERSGHSPWALLEAVVEYLTTWITGLPFHGVAQDLSGSRLQEASILFDILLAGATVTYTASQFRLISLTGNIFPIDRRRRLRKPKLGRPPEPAPALEQKRSATLVDPEEVGPLLFAAVLFACLGQLLWLWLVERGGLTIPDAVWRLVVLVWVFSLVLIPLVGLLAYLGQRRLTPEESALYLQDQLWRQTRREQSRIGRWLAWAGRRQRIRRERRKAGERLPPPVGTAESKEKP